MPSKALEISYKDGVRKIIFNRPEKKNAMNLEVYQTLAKVLNTDAEDDNIVVTIITGRGDFYSSGNDLISALNMDKVEGLKGVHDLVEAFIKYPKILIAVVNGPAIGIAATTAALCDIVYVSDRAYFLTPFVNSGLCAEGASSYSYPLILGRSKASEMILLGKKLSAHEAYTFGLASQVIPYEKLEEFIESLHSFGKLPVNSVKINKRLLAKNFNTILCECNKRECDQLVECFESEDFQQTIIKFVERSNRKSKL